jgi:hypothetical protein
MAKLKFFISEAFFFCQILANTFGMQFISQKPTTKEIRLFTTPSNKRSVYGQIREDTYSPLHINTRSCFSTIDMSTLLVCPVVLNNSIIYLAPVNGKVSRYKCLGGIYKFLLLKSSPDFLIIIAIFLE